MIEVGFHAVMMNNMDQIINIEPLSGHYIVTVGDRQIMDNRKIRKTKT